MIVNAGVSNPSATKMLADRIGDRVRSVAAEHQLALEIDDIPIRKFAAELGPAIVANHFGPGLNNAIEKLTDADGLIVATPVYKAGVSGLLKSFVDVLDDDLLIAKPVALAATASTARHTLVVDGELRSLFAFMRAMTVPTSLFADADDWGSSELPARIDRCAHELVMLLVQDIGSAVRDQVWRSYDHGFDSLADEGAPIDIDSKMMKLAAGGSARGLP